MNYRSTRDNKICFASTNAIIKGLSPEGGLFVPDTIPFVNYEEISKLAEMNYRERAKYILGRFL